MKHILSTSYLCPHLIVSDKIFSTLEKEVASHISVRAGNDWFRPLELAKEVDLYNTSRGKCLKPLPNVLTRYNPVKSASRVFLSEVKNFKCVCCAESHPLYKCAVYLKLPVTKRIDVIKANNLCFIIVFLHLIEQKTVNRDMVVQTVKSDIITPYITQSERETRK
ncbi:DUF1758 domain-containing protein [Trichonephila clavata]|uniref:DUF1758 domain-containing protein n=1 Tax=Trichonephila clavata TaxID=2740835 RepID=A0A8X6LEQ3_TRICU|nr:DUF1758 domain-containing protein [Trichonephila clavata]